jgi:hypothetical protein
MDWQGILHFILEHIKAAGIWFWLFLVSETLSEIRWLQDNSVFQMVRRLFRIFFFLKTGKTKDDFDK